MQNKVRNIRISDELWNMVIEKSAQEQTSISDWVRTLFSKAVECNKLDDLQNVVHESKLDDMHIAIDKIWGAIQYLSKSNQLNIDLKIIDDAVEEKHCSSS